MPPTPRSIHDRYLGKAAWPPCTPLTDLPTALKHVATHHSDQCLLWLAGKSSGYGMIGRGGKRGGNVYAHRIALDVHSGPAPFDDACALHSCDVPACVNPAHLRWGTKKDNIHDAQSRGRFPVPAMANPGERNGQSKLTDADVIYVRRQLLAAVPMTHIARELGVTPGVVNHIKHGRSWTHVQLEESA